jgi:hypothetical protein
VNYINKVKVTPISNVKRAIYECNKHSLNTRIVKDSINIQYSITNGYGLEDRMIGVRFPAGFGIFLFDIMSKPLWGPASLLSDGYQGLFPWGKVAGA